MKKSTKVLLVIFCLLVLIVAAGIAFILWRGPEVPSKTILEARLGDGLVEYVPDEPVAQLLYQDQMRLRDLVEAIQAAADDQRVVALVAHVQAGGLGLAQVQELRDAVIAFRKAGKPAVAFADTFGEFGPGHNAYYLAAAFDQIYLQPSGDLGLAGLLMESPFLKGSLEKLGIQPRMDHRREYKNAMNLFTEDKFTDAHREAMEGIMNSAYRQMLRGISQARGMDEDKLDALIQQGPFYGKEAVEANLVDGLAYRDEVYQKVREEAGDDAELLYLQEYWSRAEKPYASGSRTVALVYGVGNVVRGESRYEPMLDSFVLGGDSVAAALRAAAQDKRVEAIVFRVDSPGGSYVASDMVWREVVRAREAGKPVIVSMGNVAGSGGYFVAMAANMIVAQPSTITGSIGVLGGKMLTNGFWDKLGVSFDSVQTTPNADFWDASHDYSPEEWVRLQDWLDRVYEDFTSKVADGRHMPLEKVLEVAKGRIWSGEDAKEIGLVDELGGFNTALRLARQEAGIPENVRIRIQEFPPARSTFDLLFGEDPSSSDEAVRALTVQALRELQPAIRLANQTGLLGARRGVLQMPFTEPLR